MDITNHEVLCTEPVRLKEPLPLTGGRWGLTCVDVKFIHWCKGFLEEEHFNGIRRTAEFCALLNQ